MLQRAVCGKEVREGRISWLGDIFQRSEVESGVVLAGSYCTAYIPYNRKKASLDGQKMDVDEVWMGEVGEEKTCGLFGGGAKSDSSEQKPTLPFQLPHLDHRID